MDELGVSVIYISHRLGEIEQIDDRAVAMRDGRNAGELGKVDVKHEKMVALMVGGQKGSVKGAVNNS